MVYQIREKDLSHRCSGADKMIINNKKGMPRVIIILRCYYVPLKSAGSIHNIYLSISLLCTRAAAAVSNGGYKICFGAYVI